MDFDVDNMNRHRGSISLMASVAIGAKYMARLAVSSSLAGFLQLCINFHSCCSHKMIS